MKRFVQLSYLSAENRKYMQGDFAKEAHRIGYILGYEAAILHVLKLNIHDEQKRKLIENLLTQDASYDEDLD